MKLKQAIKETFDEVVGLTQHLTNDNFIRSIIGVVMVGFGLLSFFSALATIVWTITLIVVGDYSQFVYGEDTWMLIPVTFIICVVSGFISRVLEKVLSE